MLYCYNFLLTNATVCKILFLCTDNDVLVICQTGKDRGAPQYRRFRAMQEVQGKLVTHFIGFAGCN